ncbi:ferritin-like domain-containing protein [Anthocerotibacter panamensis]|uniref:ferritin-like domain-containing protein n=1 Tax=Anthocerotibacter panamensis TaxID=2857077 RepID=UPI001C407508|nr:ferritin-like protein [Anthocerotibacter panamensis]
MKRSIVELMNVSSDQHDLNWLKDSLQAAIELELSTLPPYLCALWSIKISSGTAYSLIKNIVLEEMLHMGLACNMLTALGVAPVINNKSDVPTYPGPLPGGVRPWLTVYLAGLTKDYLNRVCMQIEFPEDGPIAPPPSLVASSENYPTIGAFYDAILAAFMTLDPPLSLTNQLDGATLNGYPLYTIASLDDVKKAITEIKEQGEGTSQSPGDGGSGGEFAHYYEFAEIFYGKTLVQQSDGSWKYTGDTVAFPEVYPMTPIPKGGYVNPSPTVQAALLSFNQTYTSLLSSLESAWAKGSEDDLSAAIGTMFSLKSLAVALMKMPLPDGSGGVYGPDFLLASS